MEIYDQLLRFPLFLGMSHADLMEVVGHTRLGFSKLPAGKWLVREGEPCTHLIFLTHGTLQCETQSADHSCRVVEHLSAPYTLQPEQLFGLSQRYTSSYKTKTVCNLISIERQEVRLLTETQLVFRLNLLNALSTETQRLLLLALSLPCRSEDILRAYAADSRRPERQPTGHQSSAERDGARPTAYPAQRTHRDSLHGAFADVNEEG